MFFAQATQAAQAVTEHVNNQNIAVYVLVTLLAGGGWLAKMLFDKVPVWLDRADKLEEKRSEAMEKLGNRIEKSMDKFTANVNSTLEDVRECVEETNRLSASFIAHIKTPGSNGGARETTKWR